MQNSVDAQEPRGPTDTDDDQEARFSWSGTGPYSLRTKYTPTPGIPIWYMNLTPSWVHVDFKVNLGRVWGYVKV